MHLLESVLPVARLSVQVHNCDDLEMSSPGAIYQSIGEVAYTALTEVVLQYLVHERMALDPFRGRAHSGQEALPQSDLLGFIIADRFPQFSSGSRMESNRCHLNSLSRSANTFSAGTRLTLPSSSSRHRRWISAIHSSLTGNASSKSRLSSSFSARNARDLRGRCKALSVILAVATVILLLYRIFVTLSKELGSSRFIEELFFY